MFKKKMKRETAVLAVILGVALVFAGCGSDTSSGTSSAGTTTNESAASTQTTDAKDLKPVKIAAASATAQLSENALLAQNLGYIDEELATVGYKPDYVGFAGAGPAINEAFAAGEIDYAFYADFPVITANSNGVKIKVIGTANQEMNYALLVTEDSGISSGADLSGKKIIVTPGTILYKYFSELCGKYNIDPSSVEQVNALSDAQTVLASGEADGLITSLGGAALYESMGLGKVVEDTTSDLDDASGFLLAGRADYVDENPDVDKALLRALKRSADYAAENPDQVYSLLKTEATSEESLKKVYSYDTSFGYFNPEISDKYLSRAKSVYEFCKSSNLLGGSDVNLDDIFDSTYVDEVLAESK